MKIIRRILVVVVSVVVGFALFLAGSVLVDTLIGGDRLAALTNTRLPNPNGPEIRAYVARPATPGNYPVVIMIHEFWGVRADLLGKADALAAEGYIVIAPDVFRGRTTEWIPSAIYNVVSTPAAQVVSDLDAVYAWLETQPDARLDRVGILGFCFGGGTALRYSLHNPRLASTVILYGTLITDPEQLKSLPGPVLGIFGGADQSIAVEEVKAFEVALTALGVPHEISIYEGQPHAFITSIEAIRQGGPQGEAWAEVVAFLKQTLQDAPASRHATPATTIAAMDWMYYARLVYEHTFGTATHEH